MKKSWPKVRKDGARYVVDCRIKGKGERRFFATRGEADGWAQQQRIRRINEGVNSAAMPERLRIEALECQRKLEPFNASLTDAVDYYIGHLRPVGEHRSVGEVIDEFLEAKEKAGRRQSYISIQRNVLGSFGRSFPERMIHDVTAAEIEKWIRARGSLRTQRNYQNDLRNLFGFAIRRGHLSENPVSTLEQITIDEKQIQILTVEQAETLLQNAAEMTPAVAIGCFAGLRTSEIRALDWAEISVSEQHITVTSAKAKARQRRIVEMSDNLADWLRPYAKESGQVIPADFARRFHLLTKTAGITPWPRNALRHSAASYHLAFYRNESRTQAMLGHESGRMLFQHYRELVKPKDAARFWAIHPPR